MFAAIRATWHRLADNGIGEGDSLSERKLKRVVNKSIMIGVLGISLQPLVFAVFWYFLMGHDPEKYRPYAYEVLLPVMTITVLVALYPFAHRRWGIAGIFLAGQLFVMVFCLSFGNLGFQVTYMLFFLLAFYGTAPERRLLRGWFLFSNLVMLVATEYYLRNYPPLFPLEYAPIKAVAPFTVVVIIALWFIFAFYQLWDDSIRLDDQLEEQRNRSDRLLLNILPARVADELKETGRSRPQRIEAASVLFTDFVGFTAIAEAFSPEEVVAELDRCFSYFDQVTEKYNLEKLKTIGDSFMCAGGLPEPNRSHAVDCCLAALEIRSFIEQMKETRSGQGHDYWQLRLGIHTGPVVAGVVGHKKFAYDIWGDTVNTASRMESSGLVGRINISAVTYEQVGHLFDCTHRGKVAAKNKGDIDMYIIEGIKKELSLDSQGLVPDERFWQAVAPD